MTGLQRIDRRAYILVSIVTYSPDIVVLEDCLRSLVISLSYALSLKRISCAKIVIVDNGPGSNWSVRLQKMLDFAVSSHEHIVVDIITGHGNVGFGTGHNIAAESCDSQYYLILNPDVILAYDAITNAVTFMEQNNNIGLLTPYACNANGEKQFLCKRYPALFDLLLRGFCPDFIKFIFRKRLEHYEMRQLPEDKLSTGIPIASGCFMFLRRQVWNNIGGFDPNFFLYFEDFDLSKRVNGISNIAYVPYVKIRHFGGNAASKGISHIKYFSKSALKFYKRYGFKFF